MLNSSNARQVSRMSSAARSAPASRSGLPSWVSRSSRSAWTTALSAPDGHDDQVPVPGGELFQRGEELVTFGAARGPADALLGLACRRSSVLEILLGFHLCLGGTFARAVEERCAAARRLEAGSV